MEGCSSPLVVKFADTQKEKEQKKVLQLQNNLWSLSTTPIAAQTVPTAATANLINPQYLTVSFQIITQRRNISMSNRSSSLAYFLYIQRCAKWDHIMNLRMVWGRATHIT
jgi:hypothetical protein